MCVCVCVKNVELYLIVSSIMCKNVFVYSGGQNIQQECNDYIENNGPLQANQVFVSSAGNLPCKYVMHAVSPQWKERTENEENDLYDSVYSLLTEASKLNLKQIALTPIGAGMHGFPIEKSLNNIIDAIKNYVIEESVISLQTVFLTSIDTKEVKEMVVQLKSFFPEDVSVIRTVLDDKMESEGTFIRKHYSCWDVFFVPS